MIRGQRESEHGERRVSLAEAVNVLLIRVRSCSVLLCLLFPALRWLAPCLFRSFRSCVVPVPSRDNTYRAYKRKMLAADPNWKSIYQLNSEKRINAAREARRAAGYPDERYEAPDSIRARIQVGARCIVEPGDRRGTVKYVGPVPELPNYEVSVEGAPQAELQAAYATQIAAGAAMPGAGAAAPAAAPAAADSAASASGASPTDGAPLTSANFIAGSTVPLLGECLWIGVQLDEPVGKHDGIIKGKRYFQANHHAGIFAKPSAVRTGDFPEVDPFADEDEEEQAPPALEEAKGGKDKYEEL